jgi:hypothetical protein
MADTKSKKTDSAKKIIDVKSGGDAASGTSRPIIVSNRPIVKDPMMAEVSQLTGGLEASEVEPPVVDQTPSDAGGAPEIIKQKKVPIKVSAHSEPSKDTVDTTKDILASVPPSKKKLIIKPIEKTADEKSVVTVVSEEPEATAPESAKTEIASEPETLPEQIGTTMESTATTQAQPETPLASVQEEKKEVKDKEQTQTETPVEEEIITDGEAPTETADAEDIAKDDEAESTEQLGADLTPGAKDQPDKKVRKSGELSAEQQKAVESGEYFLPITTAETRRLRREIVFSTLFVTILIVVWLDIMLDAGLLRVGNLQAVTHFF